MTTFEQRVKAEILSWAQRHVSVDELFFEVRLGKGTREELLEQEVRASSELKALWKDRISALQTGQNAVFSLTHSAGSTVALGLIFTGSNLLKGVGVDLELKDRAISDAAFQRFSTPEERQRFASLMRVELWTLKEALFKADPDNEGKVVWDFGLKDLRFEGDDRAVGEGIPTDRYRRFCLLLRCENWVFALSLLLESDPSL